MEIILASDRVEYENLEIGKNLEVYYERMAELEKIRRANGREDL